MCNTDKDISQFSRKADQPDGFNYWCRSCASEKYFENREHNIAVSLEWKRKNQDRYRAYRKDYYSRPEVVYQSKIRREQNREHLLKLQKEWYLRNKEYHTNRCKQYYLDNPEVYQKSSAKRRATVFSALVEGAELPTVSGLVDRDGPTCFYCGCVLDLRRRVRGTSPSNNAVEIDHVLPLSKGGKHTKDNAVLACRVCNREKAVKTLEEYFIYCLLNPR